MVQILIHEDFGKGWSIERQGLSSAILLDCSCCTGCGLSARMYPNLVIEIYKEKEMLNGGDKIWHAKF